MDVLIKLEDQLDESNNKLKKMVLKQKILEFKLFAEEKSSNSNLKNSIQFLSSLISEFCKEELIILIDEIDNPIMAMISSHKEILTKSKTSEIESKTNDIIIFMEFLIDFLSCICKAEPDIKNLRIKSIIMTGITDTLSESSRLNNIKKFNMM